MRVRVRLSSFRLKLCYYDVALDYITCHVHVARDHVDAAHVDLGLPTTETPPGLQGLSTVGVVGVVHRSSSGCLSRGIDITSPPKNS